MKKVLLTILDGFGINENEYGNSIKLAKPETIDYIFKSYPTTKISASGLDVGLPDGQMGNSEVGHMNIGAGRIIYQDLTRINKDIKEGNFFKKKELVNAINYAKDNKKKLHLLGLLSDGGVHSHINHLFAILDLCQMLNFKDVYIHAILDGRDTDPLNGIKYLKELDKKLNDIKLGNIATVIGRFYTMDRDQRWDRVLKGYELLTEGKGEYTNNLFETINKHYETGNTDEFMEPILVCKDGLVEENDTIIFYNFRSDRAREITKAFVLDDFDFFQREKLNVSFYCMTLYDENINNVKIIYNQEFINNTLGEVVSNNNLKQLRIAETEKYAHVTFFLNGGVETKFKGEDRILIPSPKEIKTYDLKPEMSANLVCDKVVEAIDSDIYDLIVLNFANPDMVGHTGSLEASIEAIKVIDKCLNRILNKVLEKDYAMVLTADHGNCEVMINEDKSINTAHTTNLVPLSVINYDCKLKDGKLANIAPTILEIMELEKPSEMTEDSLIKM